MFKVLPLLFLNNSPGILKRRSHHKLAVCIHFNILKKNESTTIHNAACFLFSSSNKY